MKPAAILNSNEGIKSTDGGVKLAAGYNLKRIQEKCQIR